MRRAARVDENQSDIVAQLRQIGASVYPTHTLGKGFPDLVVAYQGKNYLIEIKDPAKGPSKRRLTTDEEKFHAEWLGPVFIVETVEGFLSQIKAHEARAV